MPCDSENESHADLIEHSASIPRRAHEGNSTLFISVVLSRHGGFGDGAYIYKAFDFISLGRDEPERCGSAAFENLKMIILGS